jgi:predicted nucleic acid-binding protein
MKQFLLDTNICIHYLKGEFDLLIGCTAIVHELTLVTRNTKDFVGLSAIRLENWIDNPEL